MMNPFKPRPTDDTDDAERTARRAKLRATEEQRLAELKNQLTELDYNHKHARWPDHAGYADIRRRILADIDAVTSNLRALS